MTFTEEDRKPLHAVDWVVIAVYFLACIIVGLWVSLKLLSSFVRHYINGPIFSRCFAKGSFRGNSDCRSSEYLPAWLMQIFKFCKVSTVKLASICLLQLKYHSIRVRKSLGNELAHSEMKKVLRCVSNFFLSSAWEFGVRKIYTKCLTPTAQIFNL